MSKPEFGPSSLITRRGLVAGLGLVLAGCGSTLTERTTALPPSATSPPNADAATAATATEAASSVGAQPTVTPPPAAVEPTTVPATAPNPTPSPDSTIADLPTGIEPTRIVIAAIGVDAPIIRLDIRGEPEVPEDFADVGWYHQTRLPGEIGPAVVAGHIDSQSGPAVFYRLNELTNGDEITVSDSTSESRTFAVTSSGQYSKDALPAEVFGFGGPNPELRLITCGGTFDAESGHYRDNFVVYASEV